MLRHGRRILASLRSGRMERVPPFTRPAPAPGGSREAHRRADPLRRFLGELSWFSHSHHVLPVADLARPLEVLHLSDVHLRAPEPWIDHLLAELDGRTHDLVLLTGDVVTRGWSVEAAERFLEGLPPARLGRFAVMGNWEYWGGATPRTWGRILDRHGVGLLLDEVVDLDGVQVGGADDLLAGRPDVGRLLGALQPERPAILMAHCPALGPRLGAAPVRLVLSGHAHGGQVCLPGIGPLFVPTATDRFVAGWYRHAEAWQFVSRGIGWSVAPVRMWCPPEIAHIRLEPVGPDQKRHRR